MSHLEYTLYTLMDDQAIDRNGAFYGKLYGQRTAHDPTMSHSPSSFVITQVAQEAFENWMELCEIPNAVPRTRELMARFRYVQMLFAVAFMQAYTTHHAYELKRIAEDAQRVESKARLRETLERMGTATV